MVQQQRAEAAVFLAPATGTALAGAPPVSTPLRRWPELGPSWQAHGYTRSATRKPYPAGRSVTLVSQERRRSAGSSEWPTAPSQCGLRGPSGGSGTHRPP